VFLPSARFCLPSACLYAATLRFLWLFFFASREMLGRMTGVQAAGMHGRNLASMAVVLSLSEEVCVCVVKCTVYTIG
jgi:hypothetical protein